MKVLFEINRFLIGDSHSPVFHESPSAGVGFFIVTLIDFPLDIVFPQL